MRILLILALIAPIEILSACATISAIRLPNKNLFNLPYNQFDQTPKKGWRALAEVSRDYLGAAQLIDQYIVKNRLSLDAYQLRNLNWHAGQLYAFLDEPNIARLRFIESIDPHEP